MKTYLDCIPCFYQQALRAARISGANEEVQKEVLYRLSEMIPDFSLDTSPVQMGREIYAMINKITGKKDPYRELKEISNKMALKMYPEMKVKMKDADDKLLTAVKLAIIGNIIDFGIKDSEEEIYDEINKMLNIDFYIQESDYREHFDYLSFRENLSEVDSILYLADNAGEVVFDRILIEYLVNCCNKTVIYAVRGKPVLKDALVDDSIKCGIYHYANIISSGADSPGVALKHCSPEFMRIFNEAEMIISKGQGNYEALSDETSPLFFLLIAKCPLIASHIGCDVGDFILENHLKRKIMPVETAEGKDF